MQEIKFNNFINKLYIIYNGIKFKGISTISDTVISSNFELIKQYNRDGFILEDLKLLNEIPISITFYTKDIQSLGQYFILNKLVDIYFNNDTVYYKGFVSNITYGKFKNSYRKVVVSFTLQPFCCKNTETIVMNSNGAIENKGHLRVYPFIKITPTSKNFYIAINGTKMEFKTDSLSPLNVDLQEIEITQDGYLKNSAFTGGKIPYLDIGVNPILLSNCKAEFKIQWRYLLYDLFTS
jgi:phage-related protein